MRARPQASLPVESVWPAALAVCIACAATLSAFPVGALVDSGFLVNVPRQTPHGFVLGYDLGLALWAGCYGYWYSARKLAGRGVPTAGQVAWGATLALMALRSSCGIWARAGSGEGEVLYALLMLMTVPGIVVAVVAAGVLLPMAAVGLMLPGTGKTGGGPAPGERICDRAPWLLAAAAGINLIGNYRLGNPIFGAVAGVAGVLYAGNAWRLNPGGRLRQSVALVLAAAAGVAAAKVQYANLAWDANSEARSAALPLCFQYFDDSSTGDGNPVLAEIDRLPGVRRAAHMKEMDDKQDQARQVIYVLPMDGRSLPPGTGELITAKLAGVDCRSDDRNPARPAILWRIPTTRMVDVEADITLAPGVRADGDELARMVRGAFGEYVEQKWPMVCMDGVGREFGDWFRDPRVEAGEFKVAGDPFCQWRDLPVVREVRVRLHATAGK